MGEVASEATIGRHRASAVRKLARPCGASHNVSPRRHAPWTPIVVPDCRLTVLHKQEVPSQREGVVLFFGRQAEPGEAVPHDRQVRIRRDDEEKVYRLLKEDDRVEAGQLLAQLDDRLARDDWAIKSGKVAASRADLASAVKTRDEARSRYETQIRLMASRSTATEEMRAAKLTWDRYSYEADSKREAVRLAELERHQAETVLGMHQIRSSIPGVIKAIYKKARRSRQEPGTGLPGPRPVPAPGRGAGGSRIPASAAQRTAGGPGAFPTGRTRANVLRSPPGGHRSGRRRTAGPSGHCLRRRRRQCSRLGTGLATRTPSLVPSGAGPVARL